MVRFATWMLSLSCVVALAFHTGAVPNVNRALVVQQQLAAERPDDARVQNDLGNLLALAGHVAEAEAAYEKAIELDPANGGARFNLAVLLQQHGRSRDAADAYRQLLKVEPDHAWGHYQLGVVYEQRRQRSEALEYYARAFALDPGLSFARNNPHIIENKLSTEALLLAERYRESVGSLTAPRLYDEPDRIAELMLQSEQVTDPMVAATATPSEAAGTQSSEVVAEARPKDSEASAGRTLTHDDLESGRRVGQATGNVEVGRGSSARGSSARATTTRPSLRTGLTSRSRSGRTTSESAKQPAGGVVVGGRLLTPDATDAQGRGEGTRPGTGGILPGQHYQPSRTSTGRLQLELVPETEPAERYAAQGGTGRG